MKESLLQQKAFEFASYIVLFYESYSKTHKDNTISKQLLRSATSIGANINEAQYGNSKNDFISISSRRNKKNINIFIEYC